MKYLKLHPINEDKNWLVSKEDDIVDCSYELVDLPYNFYYCGREEDGENYSYLQYEGGKYIIVYYGNMIGKDDRSFNGVISGFWDDKVGFNFGNKTDYKLLGDGFKDLLDNILPALDDVITKLRGIVFNEGDWITLFNMHSDSATYFNNEEKIEYVDICIEIIFQRK